MSCPTPTGTEQGGRVVTARSEALSLAREESSRATGRDDAPWLGSTTTAEHYPT